MIEHMSKPYDLVLGRNGSFKSSSSKAGRTSTCQISENLIQTLFKHDLVDELWLKIFSITLGMGSVCLPKGLFQKLLPCVRRKHPHAGSSSPPMSAREQFRLDHFPDRERSSRSFLVCGDWLAAAALNERGAALKLPPGSVFRRGGTFRS